MEIDILERSELDPKLARHLDSKLSTRQHDSVEIYPGLTQDEAVRQCWPEIEAIAQVIGDAAMRCLSDARTYKNPMGAWGDATIARKQRNLSVTLDPLFKAKIAEVTKFYCTSEQKKPSFFWINKNSNGGYPDFTTSSKLKTRKFLDGITCVADNGKNPAISNMIFRIQSDSVTRGSDNRIAEKKRKWMYSLKNVEQIHRISGIDLNKMEGVETIDGYLCGVNQNVVHEPFVQAARIRMAMGVDGQTNAIAQVLAQTIFDPHGVSEALYVLRSPQELYQWVKGKYISCIDFENFDKTVNAEMIQVIFETAAFYIPQLSHVFENMYESYISMTLYGIDALSTQDDKLRFIYSKSVSDANGIFGIISGYGLTHVIGKIIGTAFTAYCLENVGVKLEKITDYEEYLKNCGDDNVVRFVDKDNLDKFNAFLAEQDQMSAGLEDPKKYLGNEILTTDENAHAVCASVASFLDNTLCPEREAGHPLRKYAVFGLSERWRLFKENAPSDEIYKLTENFYTKLIKQIPDYDSVLEQEEIASKQDRDIMEILDKYGLTKPEEIFYRLQIKDLPREDLEVFGLVIPYEEVSQRLPVLDTIEILK